VEFQPESVAGEMREYQLEGLKWLVARYDDGINTILADEMVCAGALAWCQSWGSVIATVEPI